MLHTLPGLTFIWQPPSEDESTATAAEWSMTSGAWKGRSRQKSKTLTSGNE